MKPYKKILILTGLLVVSLVCILQANWETPPSSTSGAVNTSIVQTAAARTQTAKAKPPTLTLTPTPIITATSLPNINVYIELSQIQPDSLIIVGQLTGKLIESDYQGSATLILFDSQNLKIFEEQTPCAQTPNEGDKLCSFVFSLSEPPANFVSYQIVGEIRLGSGAVLMGQTESMMAQKETQANAPESQATQASSPQTLQPLEPLLAQDVSINASFSDLFYLPENGSTLSASASYRGDAINANASNVEICASIVEYRKYESGKTVSVTLTDECKAAYFSGADNLVNATSEFFFKPSGYSFISIDSPDGRYRILEIRASVALRQNQKTLQTAQASHRPVPVRVTSASLSNSQASATVKAMAGNGETYDIALKVYQIETDPDETFWSSILFFAPCLLPEVCDDRVKVAESLQPIELIAGADEAVSTGYSAFPVSEQGNFIQRYEMVVYFEDIIIGRK